MQIAIPYSKLFYYKKDDTNLIPISKDESIFIRQASPTTHISITSKNKTHGGKNYFMEENSEAMALIKKYRNGEIYQ